MKRTAFFLSLLLAASASAAEPQIIVNARILSIAPDAPVLREAGLVLDPGTPQSNLGILSPRKAAALLEQLQRSKDVEVMSAPSVTTRDGQKAQVDVVREVIYPTEFEPAKITNAADGKPVKLAPGESIAATPATPVAFEMRPVGVRMEMKPVMQADGSIELTVTPEITTLDGFRNYGTPVKVVSADKDGKLQDKVLTENAIQQPVFQSLKMTTSIVLQPGQYFVLGGLNPVATLRNPKEEPEVNRDPKSPASLKTYFFILEAKLIEP